MENKPEKCEFLHCHRKWCNVWKKKQNKYEQNYNWWMEDYLILFWNDPLLRPFGGGYTLDILSVLFLFIMLYMWPMLLYKEEHIYICKWALKVSVLNEVGWL